MDNVSSNINIILLLLLEMSRMAELMKQRNNGAPNPKLVFS